MKSAKTMNDFESDIVKNCFSENENTELAGKIISKC